MGVREAAKLLGIGRDSAYALVREGRLPAVHIGRRILVPRAALEPWVEEETSRGGLLERDNPAAQSSTKWGEPAGPEASRNHTGPARHGIGQGHVLLLRPACGGPKLCSYFNTRAEEERPCCSNFEAWDPLHAS